MQSEFYPTRPNEKTSEQTEKRLFGITFYKYAPNGENQSYNSINICSIKIIKAWPNGIRNNTNKNASIDFIQYLLFLFSILSI